MTQNGNWGRRPPFQKLLSQVIMPENGDNKHLLTAEQTRRRVLETKLAQLKEEHQDLNDVIERLTEQVPFDQLQANRMKKRKLGLKDAISKIEMALRPDIIA